MKSSFEWWVWCRGGLVPDDDTTTDQEAPARGRSFVKMTEEKERKGQ